MDTKVKDVMKSDPDIIAPDSTLQEAAKKMESLNCGVLPVGTKDRLEGMITDRDIVIRALAKGKNVARERVQDYMTTDVFYCSAEDTLEQAANRMHENHVSRLVVKDSSGRIRGMLSFGCILRKHSDQQEMNSVIGCVTGKKAA